MRSGDPNSIPSLDDPININRMVESVYRTEDDYDDWRSDSFYLDEEDLSDSEWDDSVDLWMDFEERCEGY